MIIVLLLFIKILLYYVKQILIVSPRPCVLINLVCNVLDFFVEEHQVILIEHSRLTREDINLLMLLLRATLILL
jgi:hypothetical protein